MWYGPFQNDVQTITRRTPQDQGFGGRFVASDYMIFETALEGKCEEREGESLEEYDQGQNEA